MKRCKFLSVSAGATVILFLLFSFNFCGANENSGRIDRHALVNRHNIQVEEFDPMASLSAGNGNFAFTTGITGLQTFYREYEKGVTLGTMSNWGWHTLPNSDTFDITETYRYYDVRGRKIPYMVQPRGSRREMMAANYYRANPHRLHLGVIRLVVKKSDGNEMVLEDVKNPLHTLNLWNGEISSHFEIEGQPVEVRVCVHQEMDLVSAQIRSPWMKSGNIAVEWLFPYGTTAHTHAGYDFSSVEKHTSTLEKTGASSAVIRRRLDNDEYSAAIEWKGNARLEETGRHRFSLRPSAGESELEFSCQFSPGEDFSELPGFTATLLNNKEHWERFWMSGGAVDFSECTDPRAAELERRVVLSQYLTRINGSGSLPPQETGLTMNSWYGKFHLEMIWWHSAHYAKWQRPELMSDQLSYYMDIYQPSSEFTKLQGYKGVRWPKMVGPNGINGPSSVGNFLIWQQPHPIYLAEQLYRANPSDELLNKYADLIFATADFMSDFAVPDTASGIYNLEPPLIPAQESWRSETTMNPPFELAYWYWGLTIAQRWKERLGEEIDPKWEEVRKHLAAPAVMDSVYLGIGNAPDSYTNPRNMRDHPMVLGTLGMLPAWDKVDVEIMRNTLKLIMDNWNWSSTWGWDYPMVAMCATRLLEPGIALDALLMDEQKNTYLINGHNYQNERLKIYLPGNGGLLKAIALMCAGWEGCTVENPGFPKDGTWNVKWENLDPDY